MCGWSHSPPGGNSWVSLIFPALREKPEDIERVAPYGRRGMNGSPTLQRLRLFGAAAGAVFAIVALIAFLIAPGPSSGNGTVVVDYYSAHSSAVLWQAALIGLSAVLFIWFAETFAAHVASGSVAVVGAATTAALYLIAVGCWEVLGETYGGADPVGLSSESYGDAHVLYGAGAGAAHVAGFTAAAFAGATAVAIVRTPTRSRWLGWLGGGFTVAQLVSAEIVLASQSHWSDVVGDIVLVAFLSWIFAVSAWLLLEMRRPEELALQATAHRSTRPQESEAAGFRGMDGPAAKSDNASRCD
jgi:hypothetical protein